MNNSETVWFFVASLCHKLQEQDPDWRQNTVFLLDNAAYHVGNYMMEKLEHYRVPVLFSGPYSYDAAPVEKVFAYIKARDLNPLNRSFQSRSTADTYVTWLAEAIAEIDVANVTGHFRRALDACERYLLFEDI